MKEISMFDEFLLEIRIPFSLKVSQSPYVLLTSVYPFEMTFGSFNILPVIIFKVFIIKSI